jgi:hypothetical protein
MYCFVHNHIKQVSSCIKTGIHAFLPRTEKYETVPLMHLNYRIAGDFRGYKFLRFANKKMHKILRFIFLRFRFPCKCEICISGMAILRKFSLPMQRRRREGKRACVYKNINFKRTSQTINEKENPWGYFLGTVSGNMPLGV